MSAAAANMWFGRYFLGIFCLACLACLIPGKRNWSKHVQTLSWSKFPFLIHCVGLNIASVQTPFATLPIRNSSTIDPNPFLHVTCILTTGHTIPSTTLMSSPASQVQSFLFHPSCPFPPLHQRAHMSPTASFLRFSSHATVFSFMGRLDRNLFYPDMPPLSFTHTTVMDPFAVL